VLEVSQNIIHVVETIFFGLLVIILLCLRLDFVVPALALLHAFQSRCLLKSGKFLLITASLWGHDSLLRIDSLRTCDTTVQILCAVANRTVRSTVLLDCLVM
jgi:hypothetical protein